MKPFTLATLKREDIEATRRALLTKFPPEMVEQAIQNSQEGQTFLNDKYQVQRRELDTPIGRMVHLSIKRIDRDVIRDWRELQEIKNLLVGEENVGVELFPSESRLVDLANQYHLWVFVDPEVKFPFGFWERAVSDEMDLPETKAKQRKREEQNE